MKRLTWCSALLFGGLALGPIVYAQQLTVDCGAGDELADGLAQAVESGLTWIEVRGTCVGNFALRAERSIAIEGRDAAIVSPDQGVAFRVSGAGLVGLEGFEVRGAAVGVLVDGAGARAIVRQCDLHDNLSAVAANHGAELSVTFSDLHGNEEGVNCLGGSTCRVTETAIRDNSGFGLLVSDRSKIELFAVDVVDNGGGGALLRTRSAMSIDGSTFENNDGIHLLAIDRSQVLLNNGTVVGRHSDATPIALAANSMSSAETTGFGEPVKLFGDVYAGDASHLILDSALVEGDLHVVDFATARLARSKVDGTVACLDGGDATCGVGTSALFRGCRNAPTLCTPRPSGRRPDHAPVQDLLESLGRERPSP